MTSLPNIADVIEFVKANNHDAARRSVIEVLKANPDQLEVWLLAAHLAEDRQQQIHALEQALTLRPGDAWITEQLQKLKEGQPLLQPTLDENGMPIFLRQVTESGSPGRAVSPDNADSAHKRTTKHGPSPLLIAGGAIGGILIIVLVGALILNRLPQTTPVSVPAEVSTTPAEVRQTHAVTPTLPSDVTTLEPTSASEEATANPVATLIPTNKGGAPPNAKAATVVKVIDGANIEVELEGKTVVVRYLGVRVPPLEEPCGKPAADFNASLVEGQTVSLVREVSDTDAEGKLLRYVYVGSLLVNAEMIAKGFALAFLTPPDVAQVDLFRALEQQARETGVGCLHRQFSDDMATEVSTPPGAGNMTATVPVDGPPNFPTATP